MDFAGRIAFPIQDLPPGLAPLRDVIRRRVLTMDFAGRIAFPIQDPPPGLAFVRDVIRRRVLTMDFAGRIAFPIRTCRPASRPVSTEAVERRRPATITGRVPRAAPRPSPGSRATGIGLLLVLAFGARIAGADGVEVLRDGDVAGWEEKTFNGKTRYETVRQDGRAVLRATSRGTASGLYRRLRIDLEKTPILNWTWRIDGTLGDVDERTRAGDDYSARVYVIRSHPVFLWRTRAVNYVWASTRTEGETWPNAYTDSAQHVAVRSGDGQAGQWVRERRDVRADFRALFGEDVRYVDAVAIMTDTDNTGATAVAYYGDIAFTSE